MNAKREVTETEFYRVIGRQNVTPSIQGRYPYTSVFKTPNHEVRGIAERYLPDGSAMPATRYWLPIANTTGETA